MHPHNFHTYLKNPKTLVLSITGQLLHVFDAVEFEKWLVAEGRTNPQLYLLQYRYQNGETTTGKLVR